MSTNTSLVPQFNPHDHVCPYCSTRKSINDFAVVRKGVAIMCKVCQQERSVLDFRERLERIATKTAIADLASFSRKKIDSPHISQACEALVQQFGGTNAFANFMFTQVQAAAAANPGSKTVLDACKTILNLINQSTEHRRTAPDVVNMSDAELEAERARMILELVVRDTTGEAMDILREIATGNDGTVIDAERGRRSKAPSKDDPGGEGTPGEGPDPAVCPTAGPGQVPEVEGDDTPGSGR